MSSVISRRKTNRKTSGSSLKREIHTNGKSYEAKDDLGNATIVSSKDIPCDPVNSLTI